MTEFAGKDPIISKSGYNYLRCHLTSSNYDHDIDVNTENNLFEDVSTENNLFADIEKSLYFLRIDDDN